MTIESKLIAALSAASRVCDDCLSEITGITPRQTVNIKCRELHADGRLTRMTDTCSRCRRGKLTNVLKAGRSVAKPVTPAVAVSQSSSGNRPWFWEGNVQQKIVEYIEAQGGSIQSQADTVTRQAGKDIVARMKDGRLLWVSVKGFPEKSKNAQARHWFAGALHDLARYRDEDAHAMLAMGLPAGFTTYEALAKKQQSVRSFLRYRIYWVNADGSVTVDEPSGTGSGISP